MIYISPPSKRIGISTNLDDEDNAMLVAHAYLCNQDGEVEIVYTEGNAATLSIKAYDDTGSNPPVGGNLRAIYDTFAYGQINAKGSFNFKMKKGRYFEIVVFQVTAVIRWIPDGILIKCTDYN